MKILLVEPNYKAEFKPLGLMKISTYYKERGDDVSFVRGNREVDYPDKIYITSFCTVWFREIIGTIKYYQKNYPKSEILVGGIFASLMPEFIEKHTGIKSHIGLLKEVENLKPDYSLFPDMDYSLTHTSRGCIRKCGFCYVKDIEPKFYNKDWLKDIDLSKRKIVFYDNNWLAKKWEDWLDDVKKLKELVNQGIREIDFNQALDCRLFTEKHAKELVEVPIRPLRFAFDNMEEDGHFQRTIKLCYKYNLHHSIKPVVDTLYNFEDTPRDFYYRVKEILKLGCVSFPMRYSPMDDINKLYVGKHWTIKMRNAVTDINPCNGGMISLNLYDKKKKKCYIDKEKFDYYFGRDYKEFIRLSNYPKLRELVKLKAENWYNRKV